MILVTKDSSDLHLLRRYTACLLLAASLAPSYLLAQVVELDVYRGRTLARFSDASRMRASGKRIFVIDKERPYIISVHVDSEVLEELADGATDAFGLAQPADVDPTNGLSFLVIDESGRAQRFDRNLVLLETLWPSGAARGWLGPFAIASVDERTIFVLDIGSRQLFRWNRDRGIVPIQFAGRSRDGDAELIDIAATSQTVYVADSGSGCVLVFDSFGAYDRSIACDGSRILQSVSIRPAGIVVTRRSRTGAVVQTYSADGDLETEYRVSGALDAVAAAVVSGKSLILLTSSSLISFSRDIR